MRFFGVLLLAAMTACSDATTLVVANRLAVAGEAGNGGAGDVARPDLDILVRMEDDATDFNPGDLLRVLVNGVDRADEIVLGGNYALLRISPAPVGTAQFVELFRRTGPILDTFTFNPVPFAGPRLDSVTPNEAREGQQVTIAGSGFSAGALRVFFGGVEGTVDASTDSSITATVPVGALPGLVFVLVGADAAEGVLGFQPLDAADQPVPLPETDPFLFAVMPGRGPVETPVRFYGKNFENTALPRFNGRFSSRAFGIETIDVAPVGEILAGFAVVFPGTDPGPGAFLVQDLGVDSNELPFTVEDDD